MLSESKHKVNSGEGNQLLRSNDIILINYFMNVLVVNFAKRNDNQDCPIDEERKQTAQEDQRCCRQISES